MKNNYLTNNIILGFGVLVVVTVVLYPLSYLGKSSFWIWLLIVVPLLWIYTKVKLRTDKFNRGLVGENEIDDELNKLGSEFIVIKSGLDTDRGNIDKIVIGTTGVWVLEVKSHSGHFTFDGKHLLRNGKTMDKDFLGQAYAEAKTLQEIIKTKAGIDLFVNPVLVFSNKYAQARFGLKKLNGVYAIRKDWLIKLITESKINSLSGEDIEKIKNTI